MNLSSKSMGGDTRSRGLALMAALAVSSCVSLGTAMAGEDPWNRRTVMPIVRDGATAASIVIAADARTVERNAAGALRDTIEKMTGVALELREVAQGAALPPHCIVVGDAALAARAGVAVEVSNLGYDGFLIQARDGRLVLSGAPERGPLYAVVDFLEREAGCRWFSGTREVIPRQAELVVTVRNRRESPAMTVRMPYGIDIWPPASRVTHTPPQWGANPWSSDGNSHTFFLDAPAEAYFDKHPEWYSFHRNRTGGVWFQRHSQFNYHNPELAEHVARLRLEGFRGWAKHLPNLCLSQNDCFGWSEDPVTVAFDAAEGSVAASHVRFVNEVADAVAAEFPDRRLITLAYLQTLIPPRTLEYAPNVALMICEPDAIWGRAVTRSGSLGGQYLGIVRAWSRKSALPVVWIYHMTSSWQYQFNPDVAGLQDDFRAYLEAGARGFFAEVYSDATNTTYFDDLRSYLMTRLAWDPDLDLDALLRDFHLRYFGPRSGPAMLEFYRATVDGLNDFQPEAWSEERLKRMEAILGRALPLADDDYARKRILQGQRAVAYTRLLQRVGRSEVRDGVLRNGADAPESEALRQAFNALQAELGEQHAITVEQQRFAQPVVELAGAELALTIVPESGGMVRSVRDAQTDSDVAFVSASRSGEGLVGGYQELFGFVWGSPGIRTAYSVRERTNDSVTLATGPLAEGMAAEREIRLVADLPAFTVRTRVRNEGGEVLTKGLRTHPMFRNGDMADNVFVYRAGDGRFEAKPMPVLECMSADWGPTGLWAAINLRTNRGILWESPGVHNGSYVWASPFEGGYFCVETFTEHAVLEPGASLEIEQTFTLLRDAGSWCAEHGIALPFGKDDRDS